MNVRHSGEVGFITCLAVLVLLCASPRLRGPINLRWDAGAYYVLGTALAEGKGYRLLNEPGQIRETQYPPLLPVSIAAVQVLTGSHNPFDVGRWLRVGYLALFAMYVLITYAVARRYVSREAAFTVGLFCVVNAYTHFMSDQATADLPFAFTAVVFVFFATARPGRMQEAMAGAFCVAAYLLRTAGLGLMLAWIGDALVKRRFRAAFTRVIICLVPVAAWNGYIARVESSPEYLRTAYSYQRADYLFYNVSYGRNAMLKDPYRPEAGKVSVRDLFVQRLLPNLGALPLALGQALTSQRDFWESNEIAVARYMRRNAPLPKAIFSGILFLVGSIAIYGSFISLTRGQTLVFFTMLFSVLLICATPWPWEMVRYLMPLNPLSALFLVQGLLTIKRSLTPMMPTTLTWAPAFGIALALMFLVAEASVTLLRFYRNYYSQAVELSSRHGKANYKQFFYEPSYGTLDKALDWIRERAKPADILASSMPHWAYIRTGLPSVMVPFERNPAVVQRDLDSVPVTFLVVQRAGPFDMEPYVASVIRVPIVWAKVYSDPGEYVRVYRRIR